MSEHDLSKRNFDAAAPLVDDIADAAPRVQRGLVHNHGPAEGRGLDCNERRDAGGSLRGACQPDYFTAPNVTGKPVKLEVSYPWAV